ncbi:MAG TPA: biotin/lipoyl-containing protein [Bacteroidia bacterium]|jgi:biotin carboxyl carrier protein|nr:biotin/lipoyl-containing protein [Bacteroidia bacterium]
MSSNTFKVLVNGKNEHSVVLDNANSGSLNNQPFLLDSIRVKEGSFHVIKNNRSYNIEIVKSDPETKSFVLSVNGNKYTLQVKDKYDELLKSLGLDNLNSKKINELKAPMPGLVLSLAVEEGAAVKKGDPLLVLEAMKMENILKAPDDLVVRKITVKKGVAVEKNQVLIYFA